MNQTQTYNLSSLAAALKALAHPVRLEIIQLAADNGPMHAGQFNAAIAVSKQDLHRHLVVLRDEGLLVAKITKRTPTYELAQPVLTPLLAALAVATACN